MGKLSEIKKAQDKHSINSKRALNEIVRRAITKVFTNNLTSIELTFGDDFEGYAILRKQILDVGNQTIREMEEALENFNIQSIPTVMTLRVKGKDKQ